MHWQMSSGMSYSNPASQPEAHSHLIKPPARLKVMCRNGLAIFALCSVLILGCKGKTGIVGSWAGTQPGVAGSPITQTLNFKPDGTFSMVSGSGSMNSEMDGTYTYYESNKQFTFTLQTMKVGGQEVKMTGGLLGQPSPPQLVNWKGSDEIVLRMGMNELDLKRK
jgi:hypothetical protein